MFGLGWPTVNRHHEQYIVVCMYVCMYVQNMVSISRKYGWCRWQCHGRALTSQQQWIVAVQHPFLEVCFRVIVACVMQMFHPKSAYLFIMIQVVKSRQFNPSQISIIRQIDGCFVFAFYCFYHFECLTNRN